MSGEFRGFLDVVDALGGLGEWHGFCPVHDDRAGNRSLDIDIKAKEIDFCGATAYPRLYIHCRSCGANGMAVATALGLRWGDLETDAIASYVPPQRKRAWRLPTSAEIEAYVQARGDDAEATRWLVEERLLTPEFLDRYRIGWRADRRWWIFPLLSTAPCFIDPVPIGCLWYPADPLPNGRRKMCNWGGAPPALYPDVPRSRWVVLVEGELDAAVGRSHGLPTVSGTIGAGRWNERLSEELRGHRVIVVYDCDEAGRSGAADRVRDLTAAGIPARLHDLAPDRDDGFDLTDWFRDGRTANRFVADLRRSRAPGPTPRAPLSAASRSRYKNGRRREER